MTVADALASFPGLDQLEPSALLLLRQAARPVHIPLGSVAIKPGRPCDGLHFVLSGRIRVQLLSESGRAFFLYRVEAGQTCILSCVLLLSGSDYPAEAVAETDVAAVLLPRAAFEGADGACRPASARMVFAVFGRRLADLMTVVDEVAFSRVTVTARPLPLSIAGTLIAGCAFPPGSPPNWARLGRWISRQLKGFER